MDGSTIQAAYTGIKFAIESLKAIAGTKAEITADFRIADILERLGQVQDTMFELRNALADLQTENYALKEAQREHDHWAGKEAAYPLTEAPGGAMVRRTAGPPEHYVCPKCFEDRKIYPLQSKRIVTTGEYGCPGCGRAYLVDPPGKLPEINYQRGGGGPHGWMRR